MGGGSQGFNGKAVGKAPEGEGCRKRRRPPLLDRCEELADIGEEGFARHGPVEHEGCDKAGAAQACDEGGRAPVTMRCGIDEALARGPQP